MYRLSSLFVMAAILSGGGIIVRAQDWQKNEQTAKQKQEQQQKKKKDASENQSGPDDKGDHEIRLHYDDNKNKLSIDVNEEIRLPDNKDGKRRDQAVTKDGNVDLRYDTDRHDLRIRGEGTIDVDHVTHALARWWQTWWEEERSARRSRQQGLRSGARVFVDQYDSDGDHYLSQEELPPKFRDAFDEVDRNEDGYLSRAEVRRSGERFNEPARQSVLTQKIDTGDQTWAEWWTSWWSDEDHAVTPNRSVRRQIRNNGVRAYIQKYDRNDDGTLVRSELPQRMHDDFDRIDSNEDGKLTRKELLREAPLARQADQGDYRASRELP